MDGREPVGKQTAASLPMISETLCRSAYTDKFFHKYLTCAGGRGYGLCWADAGSGLVQYDDEKKKDILIGIGSFGFECGAEEYPSVFTSVIDFLDWIKANQE